MTDNSSCCLIDEKRFLELLYEFDEYRKQTYGRYCYYHNFVETWKWFYENYKINKPKFNELFLKVADPWIENQISLHGGPSHAYKKNNWIEVRKKHWILWSLGKQKGDSVPHD